MSDKKELTPEEHKLVQTNMEDFQNRIRKAFDKGGVGYIRCENHKCPCGQKRMKVGQFHVFMTPAPEFKVMAICRGAIDILIKKYDPENQFLNQSLFNTNSN